MNKKLTKYGAIIVGVILVLGIAAKFIVPSFIDHDAVRAHAETMLEDALGYDVTIRQSDVDFSWHPSVMLRQVIVQNHPKAASGKLFTAQSAKIDFQLLPLLKGELVTGAVTIDSATIDIEHIEESTLNVSFNDTIMSDEIRSTLANSRISFIDSRIFYTPYRGKSVYKINNVNGDIYGDDAEWSIDASFVNGKKEYEIVGTTTATSQAVDSTLKLDIALTHENEYVALDGAFTHDANGWNGNAVADVNISHISNWLYFLDRPGIDQGLYTAFDNTSHAIKGIFNTTIDNNVVTVGSDSFSYNDTSIALKAKTRIADVHQFVVSLGVDELHVPKLSGGGYTPDEINDLLGKVLLKNTSGKISISANSLHYNGVSGTDAKLVATLKDGEFVINQSSLTMPGDTTILLLGIFKSDINGRASLDGNVEVLGENVQEFFTALDLDEHRLLANHSGKFRAKANMFLSARLSNISEFRFQAGKFLVEGGLEYKPDADVEYNASLRVRGGTMDSLARYVNPVDTGKLLEEEYDVPAISLPWLDNMVSRHHITLLFEDFTLFDMKGKRSRFVVDIAPDSMTFRSVDLNVGDIKFRGDVSIDQHANIPFIDANFYLSRLTLNDESEGTLRDYPVERGNILSIWKDKPLNMNFLKGYNGNFHMRFGKVQHTSFMLDDVNFVAKVQDNIWDIDTFTGNIWNGTTQVRGMVDVSSIASLKLEFELKNIYLHKILASMLNIEALRGRMNINGRIDTAGVTAHNLVDNLSANIVLIGRNMVIKGFDMAGLIQALPNVRSNSEVANTTRVALIGGQTTFNSIEGAFFINNGKLKTHGLTLRSKHAIGKMTGSADLVNWIMDYVIKFRLPTIAQVNIPTITMYFKDSMDDPLIRVDTRALESFMTQRKLNR